MLCTGEQQGIFAGFFRYSFTWSLEKSWYVPVFFCWTLVKKPISQQTLLCVVICVNENWVALLFQDSLVWPFGIVWNYFGLAFEVLGPCARARALRKCCLDSVWARARGPGAIKPHNEKLADHFRQTQMTSDKKPDYWLSFPPQVFKFSNIYIPHLFARPANWLIQSEGTGDANSEVLLAWFYVETAKPIRFESF